jgi:hypothetical protein
LRPNRHASILAPLGKVPGIKAGALISNPGPDMVNGKPTMHHHRDCGSDNDFDDPSGWNRASYNHHPCDDFEPLPDVSNPYRQAAIFHLGLMYAVDQFCEEAKDARFAVIAVAIVLGWPSARGWTVPEIAAQIRCSPVTLSRACARFREMAGLDANGAIQGIRPGAGSNGDKPAAVRA